MRVVAAGKPVALEDLRAFEQRLGVQLPIDYRDFLLRNDGGMPSPSLVRGEDGSTTSIGLFLAIVDVEDALRTRAPDDCVANGMLPVAESGGGDYFYLLLDGGVYYWDHDVAPFDQFRHTDLPRVASSFGDLLDRLFGQEKKVSSIEELGKGTVDQLERFVVDHDIDERTDNGLTIARIAASAGNIAVLRRCAQLGADLQDAIGTAAMRGQREALEFLLSVGRSIDEVDRNGRTPIQNARFLQHEDLVDYLLELGASDPDEED
jgi:ankyrin repeat protein